MSDDRLAWKDHSLDVEQLDLFAAPETDTGQGHPGAYDEPQNTQQTRLRGDTWEDAFGSAAA